MCLNVVFRKLFDYNNDLPIIAHTDNIIITYIFLRNILQIKFFSLMSIQNTSCTIKFIFT